MRAMAPRALLGTVSHDTGSASAQESAAGRAASTQATPLRCADTGELCAPTFACARWEQLTTQLPHDTPFGPSLGSLCSAAHEPCSCALSVARSPRRCALWPVSVRGLNQKPRAESAKPSCFSLSRAYRPFGGTMYSGARKARGKSRERAGKVEGNRPGGRGKRGEIARRE